MDDEVLCLDCSEDVAAEFFHPLGKPRGLKGLNSSSGRSFVISLETSGETKRAILDEHDIFVDVELIDHEIPQRR